jgi:hypothetical protein
MGLFIMQKPLAVSAWILVCVSIFSISGCGGGYGESSNGYLSESRTNTRNLLNDSDTATPTPSSGGLDTALLAAGARDYQAQCVGCHGSQGEGPLPLINCGACDDLATLSERIFTTMPPSPDYGNCDRDCANATAYYILAGFPTVATPTSTPASSSAPSTAPTTAPTTSPSSTPTSSGISAAPTAVITTTKDLVGFVPYTLTFSATSSTDDTGISLYRWFVNGVEQTQTTTFSYTLSTASRDTVKLIVTDQDSQTNETSVKVDAVTNGQTAKSCDSSLVYMAERLWTPFFSNCLFCHTEQRGSFGPLFPSTNNQYLTLNHSAISAYITAGNFNKLKNKPQGLLGHGGGPVVATGNAAYTDLTELQTRIVTPPTACP